MANDHDDRTHLIHGTTTCTVEHDGHLDTAFGLVAAGRAVLIKLSARVDRPTLDELTLAVIDRATASQALVVHVGRPDWQKDVSVRVWKPLANALGNRSFLVLPANIADPDVHVRRLPTTRGEKRVVVGRSMAFDESVEEAPSA